eukprot:EC823387.1.p1 GENE.EC823387.1~~EC823387.1.p1  ORF type:complete len:119 (+),score=22.34 EC823387.1:62-418(+)
MIKYYIFIVIVSFLINIIFTKHHKQNCIDIIKDLKIGDTCQISFEDIHPSQYAYGRIEVECKKELLNSFTRKELQDYFDDKSNYFPLLISPKKLFGDRFHLLDHHHLLIAAKEFFNKT